MANGISRAMRYRAVLARDQRYDGVFYFAVKATGVYCRPSCAAQRARSEDYYFFDNVQAAKLGGYVACKHCRPDRLKNDLSTKILSSIDGGAIAKKGVRGLADSLHMSERHLRRLVGHRTGTSPLRLNKQRQLEIAKRLTTQTELPITEVAFNAGFSSLRQFNDDFKKTFKVSPREMRRKGLSLPLALLCTALWIRLDEKT